jgi:hypothetical protein
MEIIGKFENKLIIKCDGGYHHEYNTFGTSSGCFCCEHESSSTWFDYVIPSDLTEVVDKNVIDEILLERNNVGFLLPSKINNKNTFNTSRQYPLLNIRSEKFQDAILFTNKESGQNISIPYSQCKEFAMAILESYCDFYMKGDMRIEVGVFHERKFEK